MPFFYLLSRGRVVRIPASFSSITRVMDAVLLLCPNARVDAEAQAIIDMLRRSTEPENLRTALASSFDRYVRKGRLDLSFPKSLSQFNTLHDHQLRFLKEFNQEHGTAIDAGSDASTGSPGPHTPR